jgi:hypothetical protein
MHVFIRINRSRLQHNSRRHTVLNALVVDIDMSRFDNVGVRRNIQP